MTVQVLSVHDMAANTCTHKQEHGSMASRMHPGANVQHTQACDCAADQRRQHGCKHLMPTCIRT